MTQCLTYLTHSSSTLIQDLACVRMTQHDAVQLLLKCMLHNARLYISAQHRVNRTPFSLEDDAPELSLKHLMLLRASMAGSLHPPYLFPVGVQFLLQPLVLMRHLQCNFQLGFRPTPLPAYTCFVGCFALHDWLLCLLNRSRKNGALVFSYNLLKHVLIRFFLRYEL